MVELCLDEAAAVQMPSAMCRLFATLLIFCQPKDPASLWDKYYPLISEDYSKTYQNAAYNTKVLTVRRLEQHLEAMGKSLKSFGLAHLVCPKDVVLNQTQDIIYALNAPIPDECIICRNTLNPEQQQAFNTIMEHVNENKPSAFFVDEPGGTGIAAANIPSGRTTHSRFKLPLDFEISFSCAVPKQSCLAAIIRATTLIIWDEASMTRKESVEALDQLLRDLCNPDVIFGGKLIVFGGDFRQVLQVVQNKSIHEVVNSSMVASAIWPQFIKFRLTENVRAKTDPEFSKFLLFLGNGELQTQETELVQLPYGMMLDTTQEGKNLISAFVNAVYPETDIINIGTSILNHRSILTPMNEDVDDINTFMINRFLGQAVMYKGFDSMLTDNCNIYPSEFINKFTPVGMSPHE